MKMFYIILCSLIILASGCVSNQKRADNAIRQVVNWQMYDEYVKAKTLENENSSSFIAEGTEEEPVIIFIRAKKVRYGIPIQHPLIPPSMENYKRRK